MNGREQNPGCVRDIPQHPGNTMDKIFFPAARKKGSYYPGSL
jgi:hypothetical protein